MASYGKLRIVYDCARDSAGIESSRDVILVFLDVKDTDGDMERRRLLEEAIDALVGNLGLTWDQVIDAATTHEDCES